MSVFTEASRTEIRHLLQLFPVSVLRAMWPEVKGTKEELCAEVAAKVSREAVAAFVIDGFACCKQHIRIFDRNPEITFPEGIEGGERISHVEGSSALYVLRVNHKVILSDPLENSQIDFLWPVLLQIDSQYLIVRCVGLEKDLEAYFDRPCFVRSRSIEESDVISELDHLHGGPSDLHAGIKSLWDNGFMDAVRTAFKKPHSQASEKMDEGKGIREHYPDLYEVLKSSTLFSTLFVIQKASDCTIGALTCNPSAGFVSFTTYSEKRNGTDYVVSQVLQHNKNSDVPVNS